MSNDVTSIWRKSARELRSTPQESNSRTLHFIGVSLDRVNGGAVWRRIDLKRNISVTNHCCPGIHLLDMLGILRPTKQK
jgi:hypothetical protein